MNHPRDSHSMRRGMEDRMTSEDFIKQVGGYGLTTAHILYRMPDHPRFLQAYVWQDYDLCPKFPVLHRFLEFWQAKLEGPLHSVASGRAAAPLPTAFRHFKHQLTLH